MNLLLRWWRMTGQAVTGTKPFLYSLVQALVNFTNLKFTRATMFLIASGFINMHSEESE